MTAVIFGSGDFCGGLASKRASIIQVVGGSHLVGLVGVLLVSAVSGTSAELRDLVLGAASGIFGGIGVGLLYRRLAVGPMHVVAPLTAITSAMVPAAHGVVSGEQLAVIAWLGIGTGLVAIGLVSSSSVDHDETAPVTPQALIESLLAGVGFGTMFILLDATDPGSAPWPIVGARIVTGLGLTAVLLVIWVWGRQETLFPTDPRTWRLIAIAGLLDTMANVGFLYATGRGALAIVAVLTSLYPIATVVLARLLLDERMTRAQGFGFVGAIAATGLIAAG
ncbi:MAG: DMT family transporter [Actinomycetia bacterium]|nr:DMT family transporter [Actinomycetes bacterium]